MSARLLLHRGIALDPATAEEDVAAIHSTGQIGRAGSYEWIPAQAGRILARMHAADPLSFFDAVRSAPHNEVTFGCGDREGASRYAARGLGTPYIVSFEVEPVEIYIDGRDFLYTVFQLWDRAGRSHQDVVRQRLGEMFGPAVLALFDQAARTEEQRTRIGLCDMAVLDIGAVRHHHANTSAIAGRYDTLVCSAFGVPTRLPAARIVSIEPLTLPPPAPQHIVSLRELVP